MGRIAPPLEYDIKKSHLVYKDDVNISQDVNIANPALRKDKSVFYGSEQVEASIVGDPGPSIDSPKTIISLQDDLRLGLAKTEMRTKSSENSVMQIWNEGSDIHSRINSSSDSFTERETFKNVIVPPIVPPVSACCKGVSIGYTSLDITRWFSGSTGSHNYPYQTFTIANPVEGCQYSWALFGQGTLNWSLDFPWAVYYTPNQTIYCSWASTIVLYANGRECDRITVTVHNHSFFYVKKTTVGRVVYRKNDGTVWYSLDIAYFVACDHENGIQIGLPPNPTVNKSSFCWLGYLAPPWLHNDLDHLFDFDLEVSHIATYMATFYPTSSWYATYHNPTDGITFPSDVFYNTTDIDVQACCNPTTW